MAEIEDRIKDCVDAKLKEYAESTESEETTISAFDMLTKTPDNINITPLGYQSIIKNSAIAVLRTMSDEKPESQIKLDKIILRMGENGGIQNLFEDFSFTIFPKKIIEDTNTTDKEKGVLENKQEFGFIRSPDGNLIISDAKISNDGLKYDFDGGEVYFTDGNGDKIDGEVQHYGILNSQDGTKGLSYVVIKYPDERSHIFLLEKGIEIIMATGFTLDFTGLTSGERITGIPFKNPIGDIETIRIENIQGIDNIKNKFISNFSMPKLNAEALERLISTANARNKRKNIFDDEELE